jgi:integrating conjugative element protein (TIGR03746 family)
MSRFRNGMTARDNHIFSLRIACALLFAGMLMAGIGWMRAPSELTIHNPPDLRSGSTRKWWEVPPSTVYSFAFYIFQQLNSWPKNGEVDYPAKIAQMSPYLTPSCQDFLNKDAEMRKNSDELRDRVRVVYEIPRRGYSSRSVTILDQDHWIAQLDLVADEYYHTEPVKRALVRYPLKVVRWEGDPERNPFGLALDCYAATRSGWRPSRCLSRRKSDEEPVKKMPSAPARRTDPVGRGRRCGADEVGTYPAAGSPDGGSERIVFVNKNVRVGFPPALNNKLRIQSTGGVVYLDASEAFPVTRLELQNKENGEIILLDVSAAPGKTTREPVKIVYDGEVATATASDRQSVSSEGDSTGRSAQQLIRKPQSRTVSPRN